MNIIIGTIIIIKVIIEEKTLRFANLIAEAYIVIQIIIIQLMVALYSFIIVFIIANQKAVFCKRKGSSSGRSPGISE